MEETRGSSDSANEYARFHNELSLKSSMLKKGTMVFKNLEDDRSRLKDIKKKKPKKKRYDPVLHTDRLYFDYQPRKKFLGAGGLGSVYEITDRMVGHKTAVKVIPIKVKESSLVTKKVGKGQYEVTVQRKENPKLKKFCREVRVIAKLRHENIACYYGTWLDRGYTDSASSGSSGSNESSSTGSDEVHDERQVLLYIRVRLYSTDLNKWLWERSKWNGSELLEMNPDIIRISKEILKGIEYIHSKKLIHGDLKPGKIFLENDMQHLTVKISVFWISTFLWKDSMEQGVVSGARTATEHTPIYGTLPYAAPEMSGNHYDSKVDMFSFGVILIDLYTIGIHGVDKAEMIKQLLISHKCPDVLKQRNKPVAALIEKLVHKDPEERPTAAQILSDGLFRPVSDATSVNPGDATAAEELQISGDTTNSDSIALPDMLGLKIKDQTKCEL